MFGVLEPVVLQSEMDDEQFFRFCELNRDFRIERSAEGELIVSPPAGGSSSHGNMKLAQKLANWAERDATGEAFDSSAGFKLPNGAIRSPDVSWVSRERLEALSEEEWEGFLPLCPDFVLELRSKTDSLRALKSKMAEYTKCGTRLGWLLDPETRQVHVYRPDAAPEILDEPAEISGDPVLRGFTLRLPEIWRAMSRGK